MVSAFRYDERLIASGRASTKSDASSQIIWRVRTRGDQRLEVKNRSLVQALGGAGLEIQIVGGVDARMFSYVRGAFSLEPDDCRGAVKFAVQINHQDAPGLIITLGLYRDAAFTDQVLERSTGIPDEAGLHSAAFTIDFGAMATVREPLFGFIQIGLRTPTGAIVTIGDFSIRQLLPRPDFRPLRIRYDAFGDETKASSRLRVWKFIDLLKAEGHTVFVGGKDYDCDLYIAQKNRPFATVKAVRQQSPSAVIVYDFDDNYTLPEEGVLNELIAFINFVDVVTCGSEYLASSVRHWHQNVVVLENPVDVLNDWLSRPSRGAMKRVGWFGAPEGLAEVTKVGVTRPIEVLTKGGDIEFNVATVDQELTGFDLLIFPLEPTPWNLAKNANRMMKALGLGVPVLVSATPEHRRIHAMTKLPPECLVEDGEDWDAKIAAIGAAFAPVEAAALAARRIIWELYSPRAILSGLMDHLARTTRLGSGIVRKPKSASKAFANTDVLIVGGTRTELLTASLTNSALDWDSFNRVAMLSASRMTNPISAVAGRTVSCCGDFLKIYDAADQFVREGDAEHLLVLPPGVCLGFGAFESLEVLHADKQVAVGLFAYAEHYSAVVHGLSSAYPMRELLMSPAPMGPILIRKDWLLQQNLRWRQSLNLWTWTVAVRAAATGVPMALERLPFAFEAALRPRTTPSRNFAHWLEDNHPAVARELPDIESQWRRMIVDIVAAAASEVHAELPVTVGMMQADILMLRRQLERAQNELKSLKAKK